MLVAELVLEVVVDVALGVVLLELVAVVRGALLALACTVSVEVKRKCAVTAKYRQM
jgi:hypothetical protein